MLRSDASSGKWNNVATLASAVTQANGDFVLRQGGSLADTGPKAATIDSIAAVTFDGGVTSAYSDSIGATTDWTKVDTLVASASVFPYSTFWGTSGYTVEANVYHTGFLRSKDEQLGYSNVWFDWGLYRDPRTGGTEPTTGSCSNGANCIKQNGAYVNLATNGYGAASHWFTGDVSYGSDSNIAQATYYGTGSPPDLGYR